MAQAKLFQTLRSSNQVTSRTTLSLNSMGISCKAVYYRTLVAVPTTQRPQLVLLPVTGCHDSFEWDNLV